MFLPLSTSTHFETVSPADHPLRTLLTSAPVIYLAYFSLKFLRHINSGTTITFLPRNPLFTFSVRPGRAPLSVSEKKSGFLKSYNGPIGTAFLGLLFFAAAQLLLVLIFKRAEYNW